MTFFFVCSLQYLIGIGLGANDKNKKKICISKFFDAPLQRLKNGEIYVYLNCVFINNKKRYVDAIGILIEIITGITTDVTIQKKRAISV